MENIRIKQVISKLKAEHIDYLFISDPYSIYYLINYLNFPHERFYGLLISVNNECKLFLNTLFMPHNGIDIIWYNDSENPLNMIQLDGVVAVDDKLSANFLLPLIHKFSDVKFCLGSYIINQLRVIKDNGEIDIMKQSSLINDQVMEFVVNNIDKNYSEIELANLIKNKYSELGCSDVSFSPIVAYGKNGANPHHENSQTYLKSGDSIVIDIGGIYNNYCSDMTRTFFYKCFDSEQAKVYDLVKKANLAGINATKPGVKYSEIDNIVRNVIVEGGYGEFFTHRTGHGIGLEAHEGLSVSGNNDEVLEVGHIFSIEPGIYLPNKFGVRVEDLVLVTEDGCEVLNHYSKDMLVL